MVLYCQSVDCFRDPQHEQSEDSYCRPEQAADNKGTFPVLRISRLADYGVVLLIEMARQPGQVCNPAGLSQRLHIPEPTVGKLLKQMTAGGLLHSLRGKNGGYRLKDAPDRISLARVLAVLEGPLAVTECSAGAGLCQLENDCAVRHNWRRINQAIFQSLDGLSLAALAQPLTDTALQLPVASDQVIEIRESAPMATAVGLDQVEPMKRNELLRNKKPLHKEIPE